MAEADDPQNATEGQPEQTPEQVASYWLANIEFAEKKLKMYRTRGRQIVRRYKNDRTTLQTGGVSIKRRRMNVLWSNVQTQKPVMFNQTPKANVSRRNKTKDAVGRQASIVMQNILQNSIAMEDFSLVIGQVVEDRLLPGSGLAMVEYRPQIEQDQIGWQAAETVYVHWEDWLTNLSRTWQEVKWFSRKVYQTRKEVYQTVLAATGDEAKAQEIRREITLDHYEDDKNKDDNTAKATIYTIWDKTDKQVLIIATGYKEGPLAVLKPPVNFDGFFPIPRPIQATTANDSTIPVPDFDQYVDQADEIDMLTQRIGLLTESLKLRGIYPADMEAIKELMEAGDGDLIPYDQWQSIQDKGGIDKLVLWFPIETIAATLMHCYQARDNAIQIMYQITGISDIVRGATDAAETATAQQLKAQFGGIRVRESQKEVQRFIRDILCKKAEVIAEHFTLETMQAMSGVKLLTNQQKQTIQQAQQYMQQYQQMAQQAQAAGQPVPPPPNIPQPTEEMMEAMKEPSWEDVMGLLRNEKLRGFVVDVETDSTIEPDQQAQQQAAVQFVTAVTQYVTAWAPVLPMMPEASSLAGEMLAWAVRQFKGADTIENEVDEFVEMMEKKSQQPPPPNPQMEAQKVQAQADQMRAQTDVQVAQTDQQTAGIKAQAEQAKAKSDLLGTVLDHHANMADRAAELAVAQATPTPEPNGGPA